MAAFWAVWQVELLRITGFESLAAWMREGTVPSEPEAQGPALDPLASGRTAGPFAWTRHPLNVVPLPVLWLSPVMTTTLFAFNVVATVYLYVGSLHEEARLRAAYGPDYEGYRQSGIPLEAPRRNPKSVASANRFWPRGPGA